VSRKPILESLKAPKHMAAESESLKTCSGKQIAATAFLANVLRHCDCRVRGAWQMHSGRLPPSALAKGMSYGI